MSSENINAMERMTKRAIRECDTLVFFSSFFLKSLIILLTPVIASELALDMVAESPAIKIAMAAQIDND